MKAKYYFRAIVMFLLVIASLTVAAGCGNDTTVPSDGTLTFFPSELSFTIGSPTCFDNKVTALFKDGTPMEKAEIVINGAFASPRQGVGIHYYFFDGACNVAFDTTLTTDPAYRDSGFTAVTDKHGDYHFSVLVNIATGTFSDSINANSGAVGASQKITWQ
jgi:hypothetical protein